MMTNQVESPEDAAHRFAKLLVQLETEFEKLVRYVRASNKYHIPYPSRIDENAIELREAYQALSDETRASIEEANDEADK
jgi:hypothetical protein